MGDISETVVGRWVLEVYRPLPTEFPTIVAWQSAARAAAVGGELRLSRWERMAQDPIEAQVVAATYKLEVDAFHPSITGCIACGKPTTTETGVAVVGLSIHKNCLPGEIDSIRAEELMMFGEEIKTIRCWGDLALPWLTRRSY